MRLRTLALVALAAAVASCSDNALTGPRGRPRPLFDHTATHPSVRFSEIHYDNASTDVGEAIEISGPAGTDLTGWTIVLYNGASTSRATYDTKTLSGTIPATCNQRGVVVQNYPVNGIQNGDPDGFALVNASGQVVEFLSYGGTFVAVNGPAAGLTPTDIGVKESGTTPIGFSLQRDSTGAWKAPAANTFGACNDGTTNGPPAAVVASVVVAPATATVAQGGTTAFTATAFDAGNQPIAGVTFTWSSSATGIATVDAAGTAAGVAPGDATITATAPNGVSGSASLHVDPPAPPNLPPVRFSEIHYDNFGTDANEAIEVEGPAGTDLTGWSVVLYNGNGGAVYSTRTFSGTIPDQCAGRGTLFLGYPQDGIQNGSPDGFALVDAGGTVIEFLSYEGTFTAVGGPANGMLSVDIGVQESSSPIGQSLQRTATGAWQGPIANTLGTCNSGGSPPPPSFSFTFSGRDPVGDPPLPVGFQDQLFVTVRDAFGTVVTTPVVWSSETPATASIDQFGVVTALGAGTATLRATLNDNSASATFSIPTLVATAGSTAQYGNNAEFGEPADADASDDFIVRRAQYTLSFSNVRNTPNWVAYDLDATHIGTEDRCDCFTYDPALPGSYTRYTTADYTGSGAFHGYGIDRGHLARSFDRTTGSLDNAYTFYFSNIIPQAADQNQGPWAAFESYLGDLARFQNREVYIIAGVAGSKGTLKDLGVITIPAQTWKVAVIMPRDQGLADVHTYQDVQVIAVIMPNDPGIRNVPWQTYQTTVDAVEALSGYDLLALLPDQVEIAVESNTRPPTAAVDGPFASNEGASVTMSAAGSTDPDAGQTLTFAWTFGDGGTATGTTVSHTYAQNGVYTVTVTATDPLGLTNSATTTATVANVAPSIGAFAGATLLPGETYSAGGAFTDPGADGWSATVDYGDGSGSSALPLSGMNFALSHTYAAAGTFTVTVAVNDGDDTSSRSATVTVLTPVQGIDLALGLVGGLRTGGKLNNGNANSLEVKLNAARSSLGAGNTTAALNQLEALLNELEALVRTNRLSAADADPLRVMVLRIIQSVSTMS